MSTLVAEGVLIAGRRAAAPPRPEESIGPYTPGFETEYVLLAGLRHHLSERGNLGLIGTIEEALAGDKIGVMKLKDAPLNAILSV